MTESWDRPQKSPFFKLQLSHVTIAVSANLSDARHFRIALKDCNTWVESDFKGIHGILMQIKTTPPRENNLKLESNTSRFHSCKNEWILYILDTKSFLENASIAF